MDNFQGVEIQSPHHSTAHLLNQHSQQVLRTLQVKTQQRETLVKCISKIRTFTQIKPFYSIAPQQLSIIDDSASIYQTPKNNFETRVHDQKFDHLYQESKEKKSKLKSIVMKLLQEKRIRTIKSIRPSNPFVIVWNLLKAFLLIHMAFVFPLIDAFGPELDVFLKKQEYFFMAEWVFLMMDLLLRFNIQIYHNGQLIQNNKEIAIYYLKSGFTVDLCGLIGFTQFLFFDLFYLRYIFFMKLPEMSRFLKFLRQEMDSQNKFKNHLKLLRLLFAIVLLTHLIACIWLVVGKWDEEENWLIRQKLDLKPWLSQYIASFYFAILTMTTVGYGDIVPVNEYETVACIIIVLISSAVFAYTFNTITSVLKDLDQDESEYKQEATILQNYMIKKDIESSLLRKAQKYLKQRWKNGQHDTLKQEMNVFNKLSPAIQQEIHLQDRGQVFLKVPFLVNNFTQEFIQKLMAVVQEVYYQPGELITKDNGMYIMYRGEAELLCQMNLNINKLICSIKQGEAYGVQSLFGIQDKGMNIKSKGFSIIYYIPVEGFKECLDKQDYETFCMLHDLAVQNDYSKLYIVCPLCNKQGHTTCQDIQYRPNRELVIAKINKSKDQQRTRYKRRPVKFQILLNYRNIQDITTRFLKEEKNTIRKSIKREKISDDEQESPDEVDYISSESFVPESEIIDENMGQGFSSFQLSRNIKPKENSINIRKTQVLPTVIGISTFSKRNLREDKSEELRVQIESRGKITEQKNRQKSPSIERKQNQHTFDLMFDQMKNYTHYFKHGNADAVLKQEHQSRRRNTKKFRQQQQSNS